MVQQWYGFRGVVKDEHLAARASFTFYRGNKVFFARWRKIYIYIYFFFHSFARKIRKNGKLGGEIKISLREFNLNYSERIIEISIKRIL